MVIAVLASAQAQERPPRPVETGEVAAVPTATALTLTDGRTVRLAGIDVPAGVEDRARRALAEAVLGRAIGLAPADGVGALRRDRWGRIAAHVVRSGDGAWVQADLVDAGVARVRGHAGARAGLPALLRQEAAARAAGRGLWADPDHAVRRPAETVAHLDSFQIVAGTVRDAAEVRSGRIYLNFGEDWRSDFTATIRPDDRPLFDAAGVDLPGLEGRAVRLRGWVHDFNGPMMTLTHPEQIEQID